MGVLGSKSKMFLLSDGKVCPNSANNLICKRSRVIVIQTAELPLKKGGCVR